MQTTYRTRRETLVRAILRLVFPFTVTARRIRRLTRLLSIRSYDGIGCAATPFLQLDSVYPAYSSTLRDSPTNTSQHEAGFTGSNRSRDGLCIEEVSGHDEDSFDPSRPPRALLHRAVGTALRTMRPRLSLLLETGPLKGPVSPHAADMRHLHVDLPDTRETVGNCFRFEPFSSRNGGEIYRHAPVDIGL